LKKLVNSVLKIQIHKEAPIAPGMLSKHYAPQTKTILEAITQDLILFDKKSWSATYQTFLKMKI
jgi:L-threonylcarbamoyladenylate synthase